jgi:hypothetical protein
MVLFDRYMPIIDLVSRRWALGAPVNPARWSPAIPEIRIPVFMAAFRA